jgi:hypothetical protein
VYLDPAGVVMFPKPSRAARKKVERKVKRQRAAAERDAKDVVKEQDGCRFPRCGCRRLGLALHGAHWEAKGMGGDHGIRSTPANLLGLCVHRHQTGKVSLHGGTLRITVFDDARGTRGPVGWSLHTSALGERPGAWVPIAAEDDAADPDEPFTVIELRAGVLDLLGDMDL